MHWLLFHCIAGLMSIAEPTLLELSQTKAPAGWEDVWRLLAVPADELSLREGPKRLVEPLETRPEVGNLKPLEAQLIDGGSPLTLMPGDLREFVPFEERVLQALPKALKDSALAERFLVTLLRWHRSQRTSIALAENPWRDLDARLEERLQESRILCLRQAPEKLRLAQDWLAIAPAGSPLREEIRQLWIRSTEAQIEAGQYPEARQSLDRIETEFAFSPQADPLREKLRTRAETLFHEAKTSTASQALRQVQEALQLWPRLPGARDRLEEMRNTSQTLRIGVRQLPTTFSPVTAWTDVEKQVLPLVFESLVRYEDRAYQPQMSQKLPGEHALGFSLRLRPDLYWSDGRRITAMDVRQSAMQAGQAEAVIWRDWLHIPRFEGDRLQLELRTRQGYPDPLALMTFPVLPEQAKADDPRFTKAPIGSGPYALISERQDKDQLLTAFHANPNYVRAGRPIPGSVREITLHAFPFEMKELAKPLPHLLWDVPTDQLDAVRKLGYADIRTLSTPRVYALAVNHRHKILAQEAVRRAVALAIDRQTLLNHHFRAQPKSLHHASNSIFPVGSWANAPASRVPAEPFDLERVRVLGRSVKNQIEGSTWSLKYPADDPRLVGVFEEMSRQIERAFASAGIKITIQPQALAPHTLKKALDHRDYDLLYLPLDRTDELWRLSALFDPHPRSLEVGGSNFSGIEHDAKLTSLLRTAMQHRQFLVLREAMQNIHAHLYETMPIIPLWQLDTHLALDRRLRIPSIDPLALFGNVLEWKLDAIAN